MKKICSLLLILSAVFLTACSSNPYAIIPNPVPDVDNRFQVNEIWDQGAGIGVGEKVGVTLRPAVSQQQVVAADVDGNVYAFQRDNGDELWEKDTGLPVTAGVTLANNTVLFGTKDGNAVALSAKDGSLLWQTQLSSTILSVPVSNGRLAIFQTQDGQIAALDLTTGKRLWSYTVSVPKLVLRGGSTPLIHEGVVYVGLASGQVVALNLSDGSRLWNQQVAEPKGRSALDRLVDINNNLIINRGGLFVSTYQGQIGVLGLKQGRLFWVQDISTYTPMTEYAGAVYVAGTHGDIIAVGEKSGAFLWQQDILHGRHLVGATMQNGRLVTGDFEGWLYWLDPIDGSLLASEHVANALAGMPVVYDGVLYVLSEDGDLSAYSTHSDE